jgi:hypothetical protein
MVATVAIFLQPIANPPANVGFVLLYIIGAKARSARSRCGAEAQDTDRYDPPTLMRGGPCRATQPTSRSD